MHSSAFKTILAAVFGIVMLLCIATANLFFAPGQVSELAVTEAKAALESYLQTHPDQKADVLAVVDYSLPSYIKRMVVIDLRSGERAFYRVAHGKNSGELYALRFSDTPESNMSSLGLFRVTRRYDGDHGLALRLDGLDSLRNSNADARDIVLHSADYVSIRYILLNLVTLHGPMTGRSNGCFVVSKGDIDEVVQKLANGGFIYAWAGEGSTR
jgi:hypothetical protein